MCQILTLSSDQRDNTELVAVDTSRTLESFVAFSRCTLIVADLHDLASSALS